MIVNLLTIAAHPEYGCFSPGLRDIPSDLAEALVENGFAVAIGRGSSPKGDTPAEIAEALELRPPLEPPAEDEPST